MKSASIKSIAVALTLVGATPGMAGDIHTDGNLSADGQLVSAVATGTPPLSVASTTLVPNLNAAFLGGSDAASFAPFAHTHGAEPLGLVDGPHRRYVSSRGDDANPCTLAAPCRSFAAAILATNEGGEVVAIDSGDYGPFTVDKALTVAAAPGVYAGIAVSGGSGIHVETPQGEDVVILRGLTIYRNGGEDGIVVGSGQTHIHDCHISGFTGDGCGGDGCQAIHTYKEALIEDSILINNDRAVWVDGGQALAWINRTRAETNFLAFFVSCDARAVVRDSVTSNNFEGIVAECSAPEVLVEGSLVARNYTGIRTGDSAVVRLTGSTVVYNTTGLSQADTSMLLSRGDNTVQANDTDTSGTIGSYSPN